MAESVTHQSAFVQIKQATWDITTSGTASLTLDAPIAKGNSAIVFITTNKPSGGISFVTNNGWFDLGGEISSPNTTTSGNITFFELLPAWHDDDGPTVFDFRVTRTSIGIVSVVEVEGGVLPAFRLHPSNGLRGFKGRSAAPENDTNMMFQDIFCLGVISWSDSVGSTIGAMSADPTDWTQRGTDQSESNAATHIKQAVFSRAFTNKVYADTSGLAATLDQTDDWTAATMWLVRSPSSFVSGWENDDATADGYLMLGEGGVISASHKRTGSAGTQGVQFPANDIGLYTNAHLASTRYRATCHINIVTEPSAVAPLMLMSHSYTNCAGAYVVGNSGSMWGLWWDPSTDKFMVNAVSNVANDGTLGSTVLTPVSQTGTATTATWYQIDIDAYVDKDWKMWIDWWIDGVAQTTWSYANPTTGFHTVGGSCTLNWNYDEFGCVFKMDDLVIIGDPDVSLSPLGSQSVVALRVSGFGTHNNPGHFSDSDGGALTYTLMNDDPNSTSGYFLQNTQNYDSYLEMEMDDPGAAYLGAGTVYYGLGSTTASELYWPVYVIIGGHTLLISQFESTTVGVVPEFPTGSSLSGSSTWATGHAAVPSYSSSSGAQYTNAEWAAAKIRWGYNGEDATPTNRLTFVHIEICGLVDSVLGASYWGILLA